MSTKHLFDSTNPDHLQERIHALKALNEGIPLEIINDDGDWKIALANRIESMGPDRRYRPAKEPAYVPWTLATRPEGVVWVKRKDRSGEAQIGLWDDDACFVIGNGDISYQILLSNWIQRDGTPCGAKEAR